MEVTGPQVKRDTNFHTAVSAEETADYTQVRNMYILIATDIPLCINH